MNKLHHKVTALILSLSMILSMTPISLAEMLTVDEMTQVQTPIKTGIENLISTKDNSNLNVTVTREMNDTTETVYQGRLGDYQDGKYSYIDFDNLDVLIVWNISDGESLTISPSITVNAETYSTTATNSTSSDFEADFAYYNENGYMEKSLSGKLTYEVTLKNKSTDSKTYIPFFVIHKADGTLKSVVKGEEVTLNANNITKTSTVTLDTERIDSTDVVKSMVWDVNTMKSYIPSQIIIETSGDTYGNNFESATLINDTTQFISGKIDSQDDEDYIKIKPPKNGTYYIKCITFGNIDLTLYNSSKTALRSNFTGTSYSMWGLDTYYIKVNNCGEAGEYIISVQASSDRYSDDFDIYDFDVEIGYYKDKILDLCSQLLNQGNTEEATELYDEYEKLLDEDRELHRAPSFFENADKNETEYDDVVNAYYKVRAKAFLELKDKYLELLRNNQIDMDISLADSESDTVDSECIMPYSFPALTIEADEIDEADEITEDEFGAEATSSSEAEFEIVEINSTSVVVRTKFPVARQTLNQIYMVDFNKDNGYTDWKLADLHNKDNTKLNNAQYTITGLTPGNLYVFEMLWADANQNISGGENSICRWVQMPYNTDEEYVTVSGKHVIANLEKSDKALADSTMFNNWINNMDAVYEALQDFTGYTPYMGDKITLRSVRESMSQDQPDGQNYWRLILGHSGNPVEILRPFYKSHMRRLNKSDWGDIPIHELCHDFDNIWCFDAEVLAFLKTAYILDKFNAKVYRIDTDLQENVDGWYEDDEYYTFLKNDWFEGYKNSFEKGFYMPAGFAAILIEINNQINDTVNWSSFKKAFRYMNELSFGQIPTSELDELNLFLSKLCEFSGKDVFSMIRASDKEIIEAEFGGTLTRVSCDAPEIVNRPSGRKANVSTTPGSYKVYKFIPPTDGMYSVYTSPYSGTGISNDTYLEVYTNAQLDGNPIASNDDSGTGRFSKTDIYMETGTAYYVKVRHYNPNEGTVHASLNILRKDNNKTLNVGEKQDVSVSNGGFEVMEFTPEKSGVYTFYADNPEGLPYLKLYSNDILTNRIAQHNNTVIAWLNAGRTYYIQFSGFLMRAVSADVGVRRGETIEFTKSTDSNFIYVNNPEFITNRDIVDDEYHNNVQGFRNKIFEQKNITTKNTFYETHLSWYGNGYFPVNNFYYDVDFYNPTNEEILINISNLTYVTSQNTYEDLQQYLNGTGIDVNFTLSPGKHKLLFKDILNSPYYLIDIGIQTDDWYRAKALTVLFDFVVNNGNITMSSLVAYDVDNLVFADNSDNVLKETGYILNSGDVIYNGRPNEGDIEQKYKGIALNQSAYTTSNIDILIDEYRANEYDVGLNLYEPFYQDVVEDYTKTSWITNVNPLYDNSEGVHLAIPSNLHNFIYKYNGNRYWNFDFQHYDLSVLNLDGEIEESVNLPIPDSTMDKLKALVKSGDENNAQTEQHSLGMGSWGAPYRYIVTVNNVDNKDRIVEFKTKGLSETILGYRTTSDEAYETVYNPKSEEEWCTYKSIEVPKGTVKTFEIVTMLACGDGGHYNKITVKTK